MLNKIQQLREMTGLGVIECKKALQDAEGDMEKAISIIHERGIAKAEKRKDRVTGAGLIESYIHNERVGVLLDIRAETDFVAKSKDFRELAHDIVMQIAAMNPLNIDELMKQEYIKDNSLKVEDLMNHAKAKLGENIRVEKFVRYEI
ncbi:translation elongation factor Ts [Candidatus Wolfebacteria bacterium]|nr:translation elongation factor Ts [Candidatus Wolfebacteria bacterium]